MNIGVLGRKSDKNNCQLGKHYENRLIIDKLADVKSMLRAKSE